MLAFTRHPVPRVGAWSIAEGLVARRALGEDIAEKIGPIWDEDKDGELANMYKRTPQEGAWFIAGSLTQARVYSKYLALQIKARPRG